MLFRSLQQLESFIELKVNAIVNENSMLKTYVSDCMNDSIEWGACCRIIQKLFTQQKHKEEILKRLNIDCITVTDKKTKKKSFSYVWKDDASKKKKIDRWEIYNAITNYLTHGEQITPHIDLCLQKTAEKVFTTKLKELPMVESVLPNA